jgi:hypothetical protein
MSIGLQTPAQKQPQCLVVFGNQQPHGSLSLGWRPEAAIEIRAKESRSQRASESSRSIRSAMTLLNLRARMEETQDCWKRGLWTDSWIGIAWKTRPLLCVFIA